MGQFSASEPLVGEIVGLRTFRVDETGLLLPLYCGQAWYDGAHVATRVPPTGDSRGAHPVAAPDCQCGSTQTARTRRRCATARRVSCKPLCPAGER
jgi:hypothetical protein